MRHGSADSGRADPVLHQGDSLLTANLLAFSLGVVCLRFVPQLPPRYIIALLAVASIGLLLYGIGRCRPATLPAALLLGISWALWTAADTLTDRLPTALETQDLVVIGEVAGPVIPRHRGARFDFNVRTAEHHGKPVQAPGLIRLTAYDDGLVPRGGGRWRLVVRLKRPRGLVNFDAPFLYESWLFQAGIGATGYVVRSSPIESRAAPGAMQDWMAGVDRVRNAFPRFLESNSASARHSAILSALTVGRRDGLQGDDWALLRDTGTAHLVAISGLHIGLLALLAAGMASWSWRMLAFPCRWLPAPVAGALAAAVIGAAYAILAGFTLPTRRALFMLLLGVTAMVARRSSGVPHMLAVSLALILGFDPLAPFSASFWLSFTAVAVLATLTFSTPAETPPSAGILRRSGRKVRSWCRAQAWLLLGMLPVLSVAFHQFSLVSPLANLVAVPLVGLLVVPLGLATLILWLAGLETLAVAPLAAAEIVLGGTWWFLDFLWHLPLATWVTGPPSPVALTLGLAGLLVLVAGRAMPSWPLGGVLLLPLLLSRNPGPAHGDFDLTLLDTGQGLSVLVRTARHAMLYDTGAAYPGGFDIGESVVVPELRRQGIEVLDLLLVSHGDNDHIGGAGAVAEGVRVKRYLTGAPESPRNPMAGEACHAGEAWRWDGVLFRVLWPSEGRRIDGNNASCVVSIRARHGSALLTGDVEMRAEWDLAREYGKSLQSDILVVPHHGSKTSSSVPFLNAVKPRIALVGAGYLNRFRHPHPDVAARYRNRTIPLLNTAREGAVSVAVQAGAFRVRGARETRNAFWVDAGEAGLGVRGETYRWPTRPVVEFPALATDSRKP